MLQRSELGVHENQSQRNINSIEPRKRRYMCKVEVRYSKVPYLLKTYLSLTLRLSCLLE